MLANGVNVIKCSLVRNEGPVRRAWRADDPTNVLDLVLLVHFHALGLVLRCLILAIVLRVEICAALFGLVRRQRVAAFAWEKNSVLQPEFLFTALALQAVQHLRENASCAPDVDLRVIVFLH